MNVEVAAIERSLGRIEGKLDEFTNVLNAHTKEDHENFESINQQLKVFQRLVWMFLGAGTFIGFWIPVAIAYINK